MKAINDLRLRDIMSPQVLAIAPDCSLDEAARSMAENRVSSLVVRDRSSHPVGILTERDVARLLHEQTPGTIPVVQVMSAPVQTASPDDDFRSAFTLLRQKNLRHLVIVNGEAQLVGVVSETDFHSHLGRDFFRKIRDLTVVMDHEIPCLSAEAPLSTAVAKMVMAKWDCVIVTRDRRPVGIITERDLPRLLYQHADLAKARLEEVMSTPVQSVCINDSAAEAATRMTANHIRHMAVVDDAGEIVGMISQHRLLERLGTEIFQEAWHQRDAYRDENTRLETRLHFVLEATGVGVWEYDYSQGRGRWNRGLCTLLGYTPDQVPADLDAWLEFIHPDDRATVQAQLDTACSGLDQPFDAEYRVRAGDGQWRWMQDRGRVIQRSETGAPLLAVGILADIGERKRNEERLEFAASVFSEASEGIIITDPSATILDVNQSFTELTGYEREDVLGRNPRFLKSGHQDENFYRQMWQTLLAEGRWRGELWNRRKDGGLYAEEITLTAVKNAAGETTHYLGLLSDVTERKRHQETIEHLAYHDALTELPNRILLADRMSQALARAERYKTLVAVCYLDLDDFKPVNDQFGHKAGDRLLVEVARRLQSSTRAQDTVARLGGDEFVLLLTDLQSVEEGETVLARVMDGVRLPYTIQGSHTSVVSASIGVTLYPIDGSDADTLLRHADQAMYAAKQSGRNRVQLFDPGQDMRAREHRETRDRVRGALRESEFVLYWQPKVDMRRGMVVGLEALIRWPQKDGSIRLPGEFLPGLEHDELIVEIGDWVLTEAFTQLTDWHGAGFSTRISVNVAAKQLQDTDFPAKLSSLLEAHPTIEPHQIELEVLETAALEDTARVKKVIDEAKALGVRFALDDFGTGYSSMTYFRRIPADTVKIDRSFIRDMLQDRDDMAIVEGILGMTAAFGKEAVAEGVERPEHGEMLLRMGCAVVQGFAIARPMPAEALVEWVRNFRPDPNWKLPT